MTSRQQRPAPPSRDGAGTPVSDGATTKPGDISPRRWSAVAKRVIGEIKRDHVQLLAAGVAFKALLALFPTMMAAITIWGLVASEQEITEQLSGFTEALPDEAATLLEDQMSQVAAGGTGALSVALAISILLALWSASSGVAGLIEGCNAAYNEVDERGFVKKRGLALLFTLGAIVFLLLTLGLIVVLPGILGAVGLGSAASLAIRIAQWPVLALLVMGAFSVVYKYGPDRHTPRFRWVSPGAAIATLLWLIGSALFTIYVENFGTFGETYGTFAGVIILMLWLLLSSFVILLGAEINAELEQESTEDTTVDGIGTGDQHDRTAPDTGVGRRSSRT